MWRVNLRRRRGGRGRQRVPVGTLDCRSWNESHASAHDQTYDMKAASCDLTLDAFPPRTVYSACILPCRVDTARLLPRGGAAVAEPEAARGAGSHRPLCAATEVVYFSLRDFRKHEVRL